MVDTGEHSCVYVAHIPRTSARLKGLFDQHLAVDVGKHVVASTELSGIVTQLYILLCKVYLSE